MICDHLLLYLQFLSLSIHRLVLKSALNHSGGGINSTLNHPDLS